MTSSDGTTTRDEEIEIMTNVQTKEITQGISFVRDSNTYLSWNYTVDEDLGDFNIYVMEWTESEISWFFNGRVLRTFNTTKELAKHYNPFDKPFRIGIYLGIGGASNGNEFFPAQTLYEKDVQDWNCSIFVLDYIRVYQNVSHLSKKIDISEPSNTTSKQVCDAIMPIIRPKNYTWNIILSDDFAKNSIDLEKLEYISQGIWM